MCPLRRREDSASSDPVGAQLPQQREELAFLMDTAQGVKENHVLECSMWAWTSYLEDLVTPRKGCICMSSHRRKDNSWRYLMSHFLVVCVSIL